MTAYVDSSAFLKLYFEEADSEACEELMLSDPHWITGRHTAVEVRRNLAKELHSKPAKEARDQFLRDWEGITIVELEGQVCENARLRSPKSPAFAHLMRCIWAPRSALAEGRSPL